MTGEHLVAQLAGFAATGVGLVALSLPGRTRLLRLSALSIALMAVSFLLLGARDGAVMAAAGAACCAIASTLTFDKPHPIRRWVMPLGIAAGVTLLSVDSLRAATAIGWLPLIAFYLGRISDWMRADLSVRLMLIPVSLCWIIYSLWVDAWGAAAVNAVNLTWNIYWVARSRNASPAEQGGARN